MSWLIPVLVMPLGAGEAADRITDVAVFVRSAGMAWRRRSAAAATFAASLELAKQGRVELRQSGVFAPIALRAR